jgi:hypothetical protein
MYFCYKNGCRVVDPFLGLNITFLGEGSFFGELQVLLGLNSSFEYEASNEGRYCPRDEDWKANTMCLSIQDQKFIQLCDEFPRVRSFLITRGLIRRSFLSHIRKDLIKVLELDR